MTAQHSTRLHRLFASAILAFVAGAGTGLGSADRSQTTASESSGQISGVVVTTTSPAQPLARVIVTISASVLPRNRSVISDEAGRFVFSNLPGGSYTVIAMRPPYVKTAFGARRAGRPGTPISLSPGQKLDGVTIALTHGASVSGTIRLAAGEVAPGTIVAAIPTAATRGSTGTRAVTDDRGIYRLFGLTPGEYLIRAEGAENGDHMLTSVSDRDVDEIIARLERRSSRPAPGTAPAAPTSESSRDVRGTSAAYRYGPVYFPGTGNPDDAITVTLGEAEDRVVDLDLRLTPVARVQGRVSIPGGELPRTTQITLDRRTTPGRPVLDSLARSQPDGSGEFSFSGVVPGRYTLTVRALMLVPIPGDQDSLRLRDVMWAQTDVTVFDGDVTGLDLELRPGLRVSGRLAFDGRSQPPEADLAALGIRLLDTAGGTPSPLGRARPDGTFEINGIGPGTYSIYFGWPDGPWRVASAVVRGRDALDFPLELGPDGDVNDMLVTFKDRTAQLAGTLESAANVAAPDYFVVILPANRELWGAGSRRIRSTRPDTSGRFTFEDVPPGDYLIAALVDLESADLADWAFLEDIVRLAIPVSIADGEQTTQNLRLAR